MKPSVGIQDAARLDSSARRAEKCRIRLALTVGHGRLDFDFAGSTGSSNRAQHPYRALLATVYTVAKSLLDPEVPANAGYYRTLHIAAPAGCVVGPTPPAAVGCRSISATVLGDVIANALSQAMPGKALAASGPHHLYVLAGTAAGTGTYFVNYETLAGGMGARASRDGVDGVRVHASGLVNLPVEALRARVSVPRRTLCVVGRLGRRRRIPRRHGCHARLSRARRRHRGEPVFRAQHVAANGMQGGGAGAVRVFILNPDTPQEQSCVGGRRSGAPRASVLRICTPGGGGYGNSAERSAEAHVRDLREGRVPRDEP